MEFKLAVTWFFNRVGSQKSSGAAEYPPSPCRLLSAALAGACNTHNSDTMEKVRAAIHYLERQKPPEIYASNAVSTGQIRHYVHNNVVKEFDNEEMNRRKILNPTSFKADDAQVVYVWNLPDDAPVANAFDSLLTLGHGDDMAFARVVDAVPLRSRHYLPIRGGADAALNVPRPGFLANLDVAYRNQDRTEIVNFHAQPYVLEEHIMQLQQIASFELQQVENEKMFATDKTNAAIVSAWLRHATIEALQRELSPEVLSMVAGHGDKKQPRVSYLPLPSIAGEHADHMIRRVVISAPPELTDVIQLTRNLLPGWVLTDSAGKEACRVVEARSNAVFETYTASGTEFKTVTPVILPHHLTKNTKLNQKRMQELGGWFKEAGLSEPTVLDICSDKEFFVPAHLKHLPRYQMRVRFPYAVTGVLNVGLGRYGGLGIFANLTAFQATARFAKNREQRGGAAVEESVNSEVVALA